MPKLTIQFVTANATPKAPLKVDIEERELRDRLRNNAKIFPSPAARLSDVARALRENWPNIVHFSAHGTPLNEIVLLDRRNEAVPVPREALAQIFALKSEVRLVVLNACFSRAQAQSISQYIDCVIGVSSSIPDEEALWYGVQLYDALATGRSIMEAHNEARAILIADRVPRESLPELISRKGVNPASMFFKQRRSRSTNTSKALSSEDAAESNQSKKSSFEAYSEQFGVYAESSSLTKICGVDGSSELIYKLEGLTVTDDSEIQELFFAIECEAALVNAPVPDESASELGIRWQAEELPQPRDIQGIINRVRKARGAFVFDQPIRRNAEPYSFGWSIKVLNMDANTAWDFYNLYPTRESQKHVNGNILSEPKEYIARLAWLPVRRLEIVLKLSDKRMRPSLRYFELKGKPQIPREQVVSGNSIFCFPRTETDWHKNNCNWEANFQVERVERSGLRYEEDTSSRLEIEYPVLGSYYSLDWKLPDPPITGKPERLVREAEMVRRGLCQHIQRRLHKESNTISDKLAELFSELHQRIRGRFPSEAPDERFETTFMTYDDDQKKLAVAEAKLNGEEPSEIRNLCLPFGLGLAGTCFRQGTGAFTYSRALDRRNPLEPENYLPIPGSYTHEFLLALPIDHPELDTGTITRTDFQRCRQLVGVLTIGSTSAESPLWEYCRHPPENEQEQRFLQESLAQIRNECQIECDAISRLFLGKKSLPKR